MKVVLSWLAEFLPFRPSASDVATALTSVGLEVSDCRYLGEGLEKVVVAEILECKKHPDADRLSLCKVTDGSRSYDIVCGASNFAIGDHVALAKVGAKLPNGVTIKESKIRGVASQGMLCSEPELGFGETSEGIVVLSRESQVGALLSDVLLTNDWRFTLDLTPNRGDCLSVVGIAREVAAACNAPANIPAVGGQGNLESPLQVQILQAEAAPRYVLRLVEPIKVGDSPSWLKIRLENCGIRSINNVVDIMNYVMLERGQPLHAFDRKKVKGAISVQRAREGEIILCLDGTERTLISQDIVIADESGAIAIAGIMGGESSSVTKDTESILVESAHFDPHSVRCTSRRLALQSESSHRFERWVDPALAWDASSRAVELLMEHCGGRNVASIDVRSRTVPELTLKLRKQTIRKILGEDLESAGEYLGRLGFPTEKNEEGWRVDVPTRRSDISREIDLVEEVARIHGYKNFASGLPGAVGFACPENRYDDVQEIRRFCRMMGLREVATYSFATERDLSQFDSLSVGKPVEILNALSSDMKYMRQSLIPSLLRVWLINQARKARGLTIFEMGRVFGERRHEEATPAREELRLAVLWAGETVRQQWIEKSRRADFFDGKGFVEALVQHLGFLEVRFEREPIPHFLHPQKSACLFFKDHAIGYVGHLHPTLAREKDANDVVMVEMKLEELLCARRKTATFQSFSAFPFVKRDVAFVIRSEVSAEDISKAIQGLADPLIQDIVLFDLYEGKGIPEGHKSMAYALTLGSQEKTLTDEEIQKSMNRVVGKVQEQFQAKLRQ